MSLDFNTSKIQPLENGKDPVRDSQGHLTGLAQTVIFMSMFVDLGSITDTNVDEFHKRASIYEQTLGALRKDKGGEDKYLTREEIASFIGLTTNVTNKSYANWKRKMGQTLFERAEQAFNRSVQS